MKKAILILLVTISSAQFTFAQKAKDVLENGVHIKPGYILIFKYDSTTKTLKYDAVRSLDDKANPVDFTSLEDSSIFLVSKNAVNAYLKPFNPLTFSRTTETKIINDPVNEEATAALGVIIDVMKTTLKTNPATTKNGVTTMASISTDTCENFLSIETSLKNIQSLLQIEQKDNINKVFTQLKTMQFIYEAKTIAELATAEGGKAAIEAHYTKVEELIKLAKKAISEYNCDKPSGFITKYLFNSILKDFSVAYEEQKKRLTSLQSAYNIVKKAQESASTDGDGVPGLNWCFKLDEIPSKEGKISVYTLTIKESGLKLSDKKEIVAIDSKDLLKRTFRVRKFQRFVPEVSVGAAYTFFKYNTYGTTTDASGQQIIASPTEKSIQNINITTMVNFNYFISNSPVVPLWQIGIGVNSEVPTLLTGLGIRGVLGTNRIALSAGVAMSWIKELDKLKVGDKVSGTSDIDKDLKHKFSWPPKPYVGIQYNF